VPPGSSNPGNRTRLLFRIPVVLKVVMSSVGSLMAQRYSTSVEFGNTALPPKSEPPNKASFFEGFCLGWAKGCMKTSGKTPGLTLISTMDSTASPSSLLTTTEKMYAYCADKLPAAMLHAQSSKRGAENGQSPDDVPVEVNTKVHVQL